MPPKVTNAVQHRPPKPDTVQTFRAPEVIEIDDREDAWTDDESVQIQEESEFTARLDSDLKLPAIVDLISPPPRAESAAEANDSYSSIRLTDESEDDDVDDGESYESSSQVSTGYAGEGHDESDVEDDVYDRDGDGLEMETEDDYGQDGELLSMRLLCIRGWAVETNPSAVHDEAFQWDDDSDEGFDINRTNDDLLVVPSIQAVTETVQANLVSPKANSFNIESLLNPADSAPSVPPPSALSADGPAEEPLGARHGKQEYFAARQHNKDKMGASPLPEAPTAAAAPRASAPVAEAVEAAEETTTTIVITDSVETPSQAKSSNVDAAEKPLATAKPLTTGKPMATVQPLALEHLASSALLEAGERFLNSPIQEKEVDKQSSHEDEVLVSAADFMQKRIASAAQTKDKAGLKRKADQISEELLDKASTPVAPQATELQQGPAETERPAKRQMTPAAKRVSSKMSKAWAFIETAAVAAVGGGIVRAGMIMTAPTLT